MQNTRTRGGISPVRAVLVAMTAAVSLTRARAATPAVDSYDYVLGTQAIGAAYQFSDEPRLVEQARAILALGSNVLKIRLDPRDARQSGLAYDGPPINSLTDLARHPLYRRVFDMPFAYYLIWTYPLGVGDWHHGFAREEKDKQYRQMYDFTCHLLKTYDGSHKTFLLGHWEGDWTLRGGTKKNDVATPLAVKGMIEWLNVRQKAVDDAKRDTPHRDVQVFNYTEVNRVQDAMAGQLTVTNDVLPNVDVDYVSYSAYDSLHKNLAGALDYIQSKLPPKPGIPGKRVFIGEYGFPAAGNAPVEQDRLSRGVMRTALNWGCPFALYWEMYNNEVKDGKQVGFWLIDDKGVKQPVYYTHRAFYAWAKRYVDAYRQTHAGQSPPFDAFRKDAAIFLDKLPEPAPAGQ